MYLLVRLTLTIIKSFCRKKMSLHEHTDVWYITQPHDLDTNFHMNNGRYLTLMDLGRFDFTIRLNLHKHMLKNNWMPVLGGAQITYLKPLDLFEKFTLRTQCVGWNENWIFLQQDFIAKKGLVATATVKAIFLKGKQKVKVHDILEALGYPDEPEVKVPSHIEKILEGERIHLEQIKPLYKKD
jgi:acyl-CoA thioesterase FadM